MFNFNNLSSVVTTSSVTTWSTTMVRQLTSPSYNTCQQEPVTLNSLERFTLSPTPGRKDAGNSTLNPIYRNVTSLLMPKSEIGFGNLLSSPMHFKYDHNTRSVSPNLLLKNDSIEGVISNTLQKQDSKPKYESNFNNLSLSPNTKNESNLSLSPSPKLKFESKLSPSPKQTDELSLSPSPKHKNELSLSPSPKHKNELSLSPSPKHKVEFSFMNLSPTPISKSETYNGSRPVSPNPGMSKFNFGAPSTGGTKAKNDTNNNQNKSADAEENSDFASLKPPTSLVNCSPYDFQLLKKLLPRHITTEHVIFSHKTKVGGRSLYFFSPAYRGSPTKPVFTTREKVVTLLDSYVGNEDDSTGGGFPSNSDGRRSESNSPSRKKKEETVISGICTLKRVHLFDPACDMGVSVWRGRGPRKGLKGPQKPPCGTGPALLVEAKNPIAGDGMAVAAGFNDDVMYLVPELHSGNSDLESRTSEIIVEESMLVSISESVVWYSVKSYTHRRWNASIKPPHSPRLNISKLKKGS